MVIDSSWPIVYSAVETAACQAFHTLLCRLRTVAFDNHT